MKLINIWRKAARTFSGLPTIELPYGGEDCYIADHLRRFHDDLEAFCYGEARIFWRETGAKRIALRRLFFINNRKRRVLRDLVHEINQTLWVRDEELREAA